MTTQQEPITSTEPTTTEPTTTPAPTTPITSTASTTTRAATKTTAPTGKKERSEWYYLDKNEVEQGPFTFTEMQAWWNGGYPVIYFPFSFPSLILISIIPPLAQELS
jgi:hypothetical protein